MKSGIVAALVGLLLAFPAVAATPVVNECDAAVDAALAEFSTYDFNVPSHVARVHVNNIAVSCAEPTTPPGPMMEAPSLAELIRSTDVSDDVSELLPDLGDLGIPAVETFTCSGGSATILGWSNTVYVANQRIHILNEPASSYYTFVMNGGSVTAADGHTRSEANNFEMKTVDENMYAYWDWLNIPMFGSAAVGFRCIPSLGLITSVSVTLSGSPPLISGDVLRVVSDGTTCLVPC